MHSRCGGKINLRTRRLQGVLCSYVLCKVMVYAQIWGILIVVVIEVIKLIQ